MILPPGLYPRHPIQRLLAKIIEENLAKISFTHPGSEDHPAYTETVEARIWGQVGSEQQPFYIGSGVNYQASINFWLEISYRVEEAQIFYTRNFLQYDPRNDEWTNSRNAARRGDPCG